MIVLVTKWIHKSSKRSPHQKKSWKAVVYAEAEGGCVEVVVNREQGADDVIRIVDVVHIKRRTSKHSTETHEEIKER